MGFPNPRSMPTIVLYQIPRLMCVNCSRDSEVAATRTSHLMPRSMP